MSDKTTHLKQQMTMDKALLTLREHLGSPPVFGGVRVTHL
jgi:hypothetical protein